MHFTIGIALGKPFMLDLIAGKSLDECERQRNVHLVSKPQYEIHVCTFNRQRSCFTNARGDEFTPTREPYRLSAWEKFKNRIRWI